jgi:hypothetical protein
MSNDFLPFTRPTIDEATIQGVVEVLRSGWLASGPNVERFEQELSKHCGGRPVRALTSATEALEVALMAAGIGAGDEVITTPMSWCATANVILRVGAKPVFVDVDLDSRNLLLEQSEQAVTPRTRAIMPVHFSGLPLDLDALYAFAKRHKLRVIEDAAHAIGSSWHGRQIGSVGDLVCFSFHPNKNIMTGEGGAIVCNPDEVKLVEQARFNGVERGPPGEIDVKFVGLKSNMSDIQARIGLGQLPHLKEFNDKRRRLAERYFARWSKSCPLRLPARGDEGHSWHMFAPLLPLADVGMKRPEFIQRMKEKGIGVGVHYPAIHLFTAYRKLGWHEGMYPNAERVGRETLTLPLFPQMKLEDVDRVVDAIEQVLGVTA